MDYLSNSNVPRRAADVAAGYDTMTLSSAPLNHILRLAAPPARHHQSMSMDNFEASLNYGANTLIDDTNHVLPQLPFTPSYELDGFPANFEDPFSYPAGDFDPVVENEPNPSSTEVTTNELDDNKLLSFGAPILKATVLDDRGQAWVTMTAELYGMFFVAEDVFGGETAGRPLELTCYRRNLFQISGTALLPRSISRIVDEHGHQIPIFGLNATISALESIEGKSTEIISVPWKTSNPTSSEDTAPPVWPLDLSLNPELDASVVSIPIAWKRLQFKHATANNGRRKGLQQHYVIQINLMATLANGNSVKVAEIQSGPIIVRGRSPRNFDSRKDVPLSEKKTEPKTRTTSDAGTTVKADPSATPSTYRFYNTPVQQPNDPLDDWSSLTFRPTSSEPVASPRLPKKASFSSVPAPLSLQPQRPPIPKPKWKSEPMPSPCKPTHPHPIDLPLDLPTSTARSSSSPSLTTGAKKKRKIASSPAESADLLYEYFPLSLDDWMPPVDAIYRPHVVHHTIAIPELQLVDKSKKKYFS